MREKLNMLVYGEPKVGKTTFAVRKNPGVLILDTEGSSRFVRGVKREAITSFAQMDAVLTRIKSGEVKIVVIDTLDELVNNFAQSEVRKKGGNNVQGNGLLTQQGYGVMRDRFLSLTRSYQMAGADVLTLCHSELVENADTTKKQTIKLPSNYAKEVMGQMDIVGFLEVYRKPDGSNGRRLNLQKTPMYDAGYRAVYDAATDTFQYVVPPVIEDAAFVDILAAYDKFFDGTTEGFAAKCSNCAKKGIDADAKRESGVGLLCDGCADRYEAMKATTTATVIDANTSITTKTDIPKTLTAQ